jgi:hypothetical protein
VHTGIGINGLTIIPKSEFPSDHLVRCLTLAVPRDIVAARDGALRLPLLNVGSLLLSQTRETNSLGMAAADDPGHGYISLSTSTPHLLPVFR